MFEQWYQLVPTPAPRAALILDVSESAQLYWPVIRSLTEGTLELLAKTSWPDIYFLGNSAPFSAGDFAARADSWFEANVGRGSFVAPIFETLQGVPDVLAVVVGAGRIFDLPDWKGTPTADRGVFVKIGPHSMTDGLFPEQALVCEQLAEKLNNPLLCVEVRGEGAIPIGWDNPNYQFSGGKLVSEKSPPEPLIVGFLMPELENVRGEAVYANGMRRTFAMLATVAPREPPWRDLPAREDNLFRQCLRQGRYRCPTCDAEHPAGQFRCDKPQAAPNFPMLQEMAGSGFVIVDTRGWQSKARPHFGSSLRIADQKVGVVSATGTAEIWHFDPITTAWVPAGVSMPRLFALDEKQHALVV